MIKKLTIFPICLLGILLVGCQTTNPTSSESSHVDSSSETTQSESTSKSSSSTSRSTNQTYYFYLDYNNSDTPYYSKRWYTGTPLGSCPEYCQLTSEKATDPTYPTFLGWSIYSGCLDETLLWNFETDSRMSTSISLYGVWVSE